MNERLYLLNIKLLEIQSEIECLDGARACPPEDVGSVPGYYQCCEALKDPHHEEHESYKEWTSGFPRFEVFDSKRYDVEKVNYELLKYLRWSRDRIRPWQQRP